MSQEKLNFELFGENSNEENTNHRRKWHSNPIAARRYNELVSMESQKDGLAQQLLKNLSYTKRNVSELIEKSKMTEWLKANSSNASIDYGGLSSDSGVSLCTTGDNEGGQDWQKTSSYSSVNDISAHNWNIADIISLATPNNEGEILSNSVLNKTTNDYDDLKEFYTPRSCWEDVGNFKEDDHNTSVNQRSGLKSSCGEPLSLTRLPGTKRVGRSADILARVQKSPSSSSTRVEDSIEGRKCDGRIDRSITALINSKPEGVIPSVGRSEVLINKNKISTRKLSERCLRLKGESSKTDLTSVTNKKSANERKSEQSSGIAKSLIHLAQIKRSNKNAVAKFIKNLAGCSNESPILNDSQSNFADTEYNNRKDSLENKSSNECMKWTFPNSNRKREEKLRSLEKEVAKYDLSATEECINNEHVECNEITTLTDKYNFDTVYSGNESQSKLPLDNENTMSDRQSDFKISLCLAQRYVPTIVNDTDIVKLSDHVEANSPDEALRNSKNIREMNTQAALIYLSETLIESAQRAEMLLMQKMKEYNDLVCRDPPQKKTQDFTCQVETESQIEANFETRLSTVKDNHTQELDDKNTRIKQLETDKKKLRQALKKLNLSVGKKSEGTVVNGRDIDNERGSLSPRSLSSDQSTLVERNDSHGEFVQALKIENNLLHTLLKEMKAELDQENATILSLAKKLEMSLGKQTLIKSRLQTDVVRKLEDRLEQQEKMLKQETMEARAVAKYVIMKYKKLIQEYQQKVKSHQDTVDKLSNAIN